MDGYLTIKEVAKKMEYYTRRIQVLCSDGWIKGAVKFGRDWAIPVSAEKPTDDRITTGEYRDWRKK